MTPHRDDERERLQDPEVGEDWGETLSSGHDRTADLTNSCSCSYQDKEVKPVNVSAIPCEGHTSLKKADSST